MEPLHNLQNHNQKVSDEALPDKFQTLYDLGLANDLLYFNSQSKRINESEGQALDYPTQKGQKLNDQIYSVSDDSPPDNQQERDTDGDWEMKSESTVHTENPTVQTHGLVGQQDNTTMLDEK